MFKEQMKEKFIKVLTLENLTSIKDHEIHGRIVSLTKSLYVGKGGMEDPEHYQFLKENVKTILEAMGLMINHEETKTS
jgi:hypothetical protein